MFEREADNGAIDVGAFLAYVIRREELLQNRLRLSLYDKDHDGFLTLADLRDFVHEVVSILPQLRNTEGFLPYYTCAPLATARPGSFFFSFVPAFALAS
eukprot:SAG31_NODE_7465_length_1682_cov_1.409349_2_plen_99_part_00